MKPIIPFALLGALLAIGANAATTDPVGYVSAGNTSGVGLAVAAQSDVAYSIPLANPAAFVGESSSSVATTSTTISVEGAPGWTPSTEWTSAPHLLTITDGSEEGLMALISDNTADSLTVMPVVGDLSNVAAGDSVRIEPAWTLLKLLPLASVPNGTQVIFLNETASGINLGAAAIYTKGPSFWVQTLGGSGNADNTVLYPGEGFLIRTPASGGITNLVVTGEVPTWNHRAIIKKASGPSSKADNFLGYFSPVEVEVQSANVPAVAGDQIVFFDPTTAGQNKGVKQILTRGPSNWFGTLGPATGIQDTYPIGGTNGFLYRRVATAADGDVNWSDEQTYISSL